MMQLSLRKNLSLAYTCSRNTGRIKTGLPVGFCSAGGDVDEKRESAGKGQRLHVCDPEKLCFPTGWVCGGEMFLWPQWFATISPKISISFEKKYIYLKKNQQKKQAATKR